jgi:hypothetical protein
MLAGPYPSVQPHAWGAESGAFLTGLPFTVPFAGHIVPHTVNNTQRRVVEGIVSMSVGILDRRAIDDVTPADSGVHGVIGGWTNALDSRPPRE